MLLRNRKTGLEDPAAIKNLSADDIPSLLDLQAFVAGYDNLSEIFQPETKETFLEDLTDYGTGVGIFVNGRIIAYAILRIPHDKADNLGLDAQLPKEELDFVAHLETVTVHPDYRGNGLQAKLAMYLEENAKAAGIHYILCTISPKNTHSLSSTLKLGYGIIAEKYKYGDKLRYILMKKV